MGVLERFMGVLDLFARSIGDTSSVSLIYMKGSLTYQKGFVDI